jgi:hypothetical protein
MKHFTWMPKCDASLKALSLMLGSVVIGLAAIDLFSGWTVARLIKWAVNVLGLPFLLLLSVLVFISLLSVVKILEAGSIQNDQLRDGHRAKWFQAGQQTCNGVATLALTFTLLGISLGIGQLSDSSLTPNNINEVIAGLTNHFSLAFMTSVIGLPLSAFLRTVLIVVNASSLATIERQHSKNAPPLIADYSNA